jgi:hypothetical protein
MMNTSLLSRLKRASLLFLLLGLSVQAEAPRYVSGVVFEDENRDGLRDSGEAGVPLVLVSNGQDVVATDGEGRYYLPVRPRSAIFVVKPVGYTFPRGDHNLPSFYRLHWTEGSGDLKYGGVPATGALPASLDFPLMPASKSEDFSVLVVADPQPHNKTHVDYYEQRFVKLLAGRRDFAFGLVLGDIVRDDLSLFEPYVLANSRLPGPIFHVVGNHDIDLDATDEVTSVATFHRYFGPANYALMEGKAVFVVLNNVRYPLADQEEGGRSYQAGYASAALRFMANLLSHVPDDRLIVLAQHIPLVPGNDRPMVFRPEEQKHLLRLLNGRRVLALAGHNHTQWHAFLNEESDWQGAEPLRQWVVGTASGSWWGGEPGPDGLPDSIMRDGTPPGYGVLHIDGTDYRLEYRVAGQPREYQMRVMMPRHVVRGERDQPLLVNVFNGSERTQVAFRVGPAGSWSPLAFTPGVDYDYVGRLTRRNQSEAPPPGTHLPPPAISHHLWLGRLPRNLPEGKHQVEVRVRDEWGAEFIEQRAVNVHPVILPYGRN